MYAFLTGEISTQNVHVAQETGVAFIAAGHHATERYGVQVLGEHLAASFDLEHRFFDLDNPVLDLAREVSKGSERIRDGLAQFIRCLRCGK